MCATLSDPSECGSRTSRDGASAPILAFQSAHVVARVTVAVAPASTASTPSGEPRSLTRTRLLAASSALCSGRRAVAPVFGCENWYPGWPRDGWRSMQREKPQKAAGQM